MPLEELARAAAALAMKSVEIVAPEQWPILKKYGLTCACTPSHGFVRGLNHKEYHAECIEKLTTAIEATGDAGFPNVITFSGMSEGLSDEEGIKNTVQGLKKVLPLAEKKGVNLVLEPLNTRVDVEMKGHPGYQCDRVEWAVEVCDKIGSPRMKILFDIYHTQIMQGDVITRIRQFKDYIGHYHTAGVPGSNDLDVVQEINYPAIMQAILDTGYRGYVGQEFIPLGVDKIAACAGACGCATCDNDVADTRRQRGASRRRWLSGFAGRLWRVEIDLGGSLRFFRRLEVLADLTPASDAYRLDGNRRAKTFSVSTVSL